MAASEPKPNPKTLALWAIAGPAIATSTFLVYFIVSPVRPAHAAFWQFLWAQRFSIFALIAPLVIGGTIWHQANKRLRRGYLDDLWSDAELEPVRTLLAKPYWIWISFGLLGVGMITVVFTRHTGGFIYLLTLPANTVTSIRRLLAPPVQRTGGLIDWQNLKPLHSDYWGEAPHSHGDALPS